jgi:hypothetical protein
VIVTRGSRGRPVEVVVRRRMLARGPRPSVNR